MEKICFKCGETKALNEFYKHSAMGDGHLNKCKECTKKDANAHRAVNIEKCRSYDVERAKRPERKVHALEESRRWASEDKRRRPAQSKVNHAILSGKLTRLPCERCGRADNVHAHHEDYDKPLDVVWLCPVCHKARHAEMKRAI